MHGGEVEHAHVGAGHELAYERLLLGGSGEQMRSLGRTQHRQRMAGEGEHHGVAAQGLGLGEDGVHDVAVAAVHTVEHAHGGCIVCGVHSIPASLRTS